MARVIKGAITSFLNLSPTSPRATATLIRRHLSDSEAVAALRPFYFAVHPDLFARYPEKREVNEESLKRLHQILFDSGASPSLTKVFDNPGGSTNLRLTFYLKEKRSNEDGSGGEFRKVRLALNPNRGVESTIAQILRECQLPVRDGISIKTDIYEGQTPPGWTDYDEDQLRVFWARKHAREAADEEVRRKKGLFDWVRELSDEASGRQQSYSALLVDVQSAIEDFKERTGVAEVHWDSDWTLSHFRGSVTALRRVLGLSMSSKAGGIVPALRGKVIRFGNSGTYQAVDGSLHFGCDNIPEDWLRLIRNSSSPTSGNLLRALAHREKLLSEILGNVEIYSAPLTPALQQLHWVKELTMRLEAANFKPDVFTGRELSVVLKSDSDGYFLSSSGQIHIPYNCTPQTLGDFLRSNTAMAKSLSTQYTKACHVLEGTRDKCVDTMGLQSLTWDSSAAVDDVTNSIERLLDFFGKRENSDLAKLFKGKKVHISCLRDFTVLHDGRLAVPIDWNE